MDSRKVIIVSGGSRGLGAAIVKQLIDADYAVATFSRNSSQVVEHWQAEAGDRFQFQAIDLADADAVEGFVATVHQKFGRVDSLVNNAAIAGDGVLATTDDTSLQSMLDINLAATIRLTRACLRLMLLREQGAIVNIASVAGLRGMAGLSVYSATKAGLIGFSRSLAREVGPKGICVNTIAPGYLETEMSAGLPSEQIQKIIRQTPLGRLGSVDDVVPCVEFLLSDVARFITG